MSRLRESVVKEAARKLDSSLLCAHLDSLALDDDTLRALFGQLLRQNGLVIKRASDEERRPVRDRFLNEIVAYLASREAPATLVEDFSHLSDRFDFCAYGYSFIEAALQKSNSLVKRSLPSRLAALLEGAAQHCETLVQAMWSQAPRDFLDHRAAIRFDDKDQPAFGDSALRAIIDGLASALKREGFNNLLWDSDGYLQLPRLTSVSNHLRFRGTGLIAGALFWENWEHFEERMRFQRGHFSVIPKERWPSNAPNDTKIIVRYEPTDVEAKLMLHLSASEERLTSRLFEQAIIFGSMRMHDRVISETRSNPALAPQAFISAEEFTACDGLEDHLALQLRTDIQLVGGLRVAEWLRGYAALQNLARENVGRQPKPHDRLRALSHEELVAFLISAGLDADKAQQFIDAVRFKKTSKDLWDAPLLTIASDDGSRRYIVFGPAPECANLVLVVLSAMSTSTRFSGAKGPSFERAVFDLLKRQGFAPANIHFVRDGEEYEADVVFEWDDAVVLIECKNRSVPVADPIDQYFFALDLLTHKRQIHRLKDAFQSYPDELERKLSPGAASKRIISIVTYALPFAMVRTQETETYLDFVALRRFFSEKYFTAIHSTGEITKPDKIDATGHPKLEIWAGAAPSVRDFEKYIEALPQLRVTLAHLELKEMSILSYDGFTAIGPTIKRIETTPESINKALFSN